MPADLFAPSGSRNAEVEHPDQLRSAAPTQGSGPGLAGGAERDASRRRNRGGAVARRSAASVALAGGARSGVGIAPAPGRPARAPARLNPYCEPLLRGAGDRGRPAARVRTAHVEL